MYSSVLRIERQVLILLKGQEKMILLYINSSGLYLRAVQWKKKIIESRVRGKCTDMKVISMRTPLVFLH